jgi:hypothetical protein
LAPSLDQLGYLNEDRGQYYKTFRAVINGRESAVNRVLDGSTYPGQKLVASSFCKKNNFEETQQLILRAGNAIYPVERTNRLDFL